MRHVGFHRTKYGRELLLDAAYVRKMPDFIRANGAEHSLDFHDILQGAPGTFCSMASPTRCPPVSFSSPFRDR